MEGDGSFESTNTPNTSNCGSHFCICGLCSKLQTSWTEENPGRRFFGCPRYGTPGHCNYFAWCDPPVLERSAKVINGLLRKKKDLDDVVEAQNIELLVLNQKLGKQNIKLEEVGRRVELYKLKVKKLYVILASVLIVLFINLFG